MTTVAPPWTPEQDAVLIANQTKTGDEMARLASRIGPARNASAARKRLFRLLNRTRNAHPTAWTPPEMDILRRLYPTTSDQGIVEALKDAGFKRSLEGVKRARQRYGYINEREPEEREYVPGWSPLPGDFKARDAEFVRMVQAEALRLMRLGVFKRAA